MTVDLLYNYAHARFHDLDLDFEGMCKVCHSLWSLILWDRALKKLIHSQRRSQLKLRIATVPHSHKDVHFETGKIADGKMRTRKLEMISIVYKTGIYHFHPKTLSCYAYEYDDDDDDVVLNAVSPCYCSMLGALSSLVSFEACCQWARLIVCNSLETTLLFKFTVQKYIYPSVSKVYVGSFRVSVNHRTLTWATGSLTYTRDHSYAYVYTRELGTPTTNQHNFFDPEKTLTILSCALLTVF